MSKSFIDCSLLAYASIIPVQTPTALLSSTISLSLSLSLSRRAIEVRSHEQLEAIVKTVFFNRIPPPVIENSVPVFPALFGSANGDMMRRLRQDQLSSVLSELSGLALSLLRSPPTPAPFSDDSPPPHTAARRPPAAQMTPAGFASLMLGLSLTLMLCGSVTFFIGFVLMPWVLGLVMVLYVAGIVSALSVLGRSVLCYATASPASRKDVTSWKLL